MTRWQHFLGLAMLALIGSGAAFAADPYPTRPVRVIVGFAAGGPTDVLARVMTQWLSDRFGQQFVVDNRPGAGGNIATEAVIKAPPDGYTILVIVTANVINPSLFPNLPFNFMRDITGVAGVSMILADRLSAMPHIQSGALRVIAVTSTSRFEAMPDIPTVAETVAGYEASAFYGFGVPRGTPPEIIDKLNTAINAGDRDPKIKARFTELDAVSIIASASEFGAFMTTEAERWARVIKASGAKAE